MKKLILFAAVLFVAAACTPKNEAIVEVGNPLSIERAHETVEVLWANLTERVPDLTPENVMVYGPVGEEIPSQVLYAEGSADPVALIFQATVKPDDVTEYYVRKGEPQKYAPQVHGRYVPERMDDYAWENDLVAFRLYGPALEVELVSPGIDVWSKGTPNLIIDKWYALNDYHQNHGEGLDAYKVGPTLGAGSVAPYYDNQLVMSRNYTEWETLCNGPIRTSFRLTYAPWQVGEGMVSQTKIVSLDAGTRFSRMTNIYHGDFASLEVTPGISVHENARVTLDADFVALTEPASDLRDPSSAGDISIAVIVPEAQRTFEALDHALALTSVAPEQPMTYWMGAGWANAGIADDAAWLDTVTTEVQKIRNPLTVRIR